MEKISRRGIGKGCNGFHTLSRRATLPYLHMSISLEALRTPLFWVILEASLQKLSWLNHTIGNWFNLQSLSFTRSSEGDWNFQPSNHMAGSPGNQLPSLVHFSTHLINTRDILKLLALRKCQWFGELYIELWTKTKYIFLIDHSTVKVTSSDLSLKELKQDFASLPERLRVRPWQGELES